MTHTAWLVLFIIALVGTVVFVALLFAGYVSEKFQPHRKIYAILLVIFAVLTIWFNRQYQISMPASSMNPTQRATVSASTTKRPNAWQRHMAPLTQSKGARS